MSKKIWFAGVLLIIFSIMYALNSLMPLHRDDYEYSLIWNTTQHITSMGDVFTSLARHYYQHGGRMVSFFFLDSFLLWGKPYFDIVNAALFSGLIVLIIMHAKRRLHVIEDPLLLVLTGLLAWLSFPHFGEVAVWMCGSTVYLWTGFMGTLFFLPYNLSAAGTWRPAGSLFTIVMFLGGLLTGWGVENLAVTTVLLTALLTFHAYAYNYKQPWMFAGCLGSILGLLLLVSAPGNYVRYEQQGQGKGLLIHIGNQFAGNGEMLLYLLPLILLTLLGWRILQIKLLQMRGQKLLPPQSHGQGLYMLGLFIIALLYSYFNGGFIATAMRDFILTYMLQPLNLIKANTIEHFSNVMAGFEEMTIYWLIIFFVYALLRRKLGLHKKNMQVIKTIKPLQVLVESAPARYATFMFALAFFNNFVIIAAPTFPVRATFSSVIMILIGSIHLLNIPEVRTALFSGVTGRIIQGGALAIGGFTISAALLITFLVRQADDQRISFIAKAAQRGEQIVTLPPIELKNRALRHVFFIDYDNGVTTGGLCRFYNIKEIKVKPGTPL